jgi:hypothetical protein
MGYSAVTGSKPGRTTGREEGAPFKVGATPVRRIAATPKAVCGPSRSPMTSFQFSMRSTPPRVKQPEPARRQASGFRYKQSRRQARQVSLLLPSFSCRLPGRRSCASTTSRTDFRRLLNSAPSLPNRFYRRFRFMSGATRTREDLPTLACCYCDTTPPPSHNCP